MSEKNITYQEAVTEGLIIVRKVAEKMYWCNKARYNRAGVEIEDIESYLKEVVLCQTYLPSIERQPELYSVAAFKASLYTSCKRRALTHLKAWLQTKKRGSEVSQGQWVDLDNDDCMHQLESQQTYRVGSALALADECSCPIAQRIIVLLVKERYKSKNALKKRFALPRNKFNKAWQKVQELFADWQPTQT